MTRMVTSFVILATLTVLKMIQGQFNPIVTATECNSRSFVVFVERAAEGGIIYIQGKGPRCKHTTTTNSEYHFFNYDVCNIKFNTIFRVVVQKRPHVQTGFDKVVPVICRVDLSDITVRVTTSPRETTINTTTAFPLLSSTYDTTTVNYVVSTQTSKRHDNATTQSTHQGNTQYETTTNSPLLTDISIPTYNVTTPRSPTTTNTIVRDVSTPEPSSPVPLARSTEPRGFFITYNDVVWMMVQLLLQRQALRSSTQRTSRQPWSVQNILENKRTVPQLYQRNSNQKPSSVNRLIQLLTGRTEHTTSERKRWVQQPPKSFNDPGKRNTKSDRLSSLLRYARELDLLKQLISIGSKTNEKNAQQTDQLGWN